MQVEPVQRVYVGIQHVENGNFEALLHSISPNGTEPEGSHEPLGTLVENLVDGFKKSCHIYPRDEHDCVDGHDGFKCMVRRSWRLTQLLSRAGPYKYAETGINNAKLLCLLREAEAKCKDCRTPPDKVEGTGNCQKKAKPCLKGNFLHNSNREDLRCDRGGADHVVGNVAVVLRCFLSWRWVLDTMYSMAEAVEVLHSAHLFCLCVWSHSKSARVAILS